ncbi:MAG: response regulator, partial [Anaerolineae bacterium]|nr:response regulator [Anaerolineae bacterium]
MDNTQPTKIVVADDDTMVLESIIHGLKLREYDVVGRAKNGIEAIITAGETMPDVVLLDIKMPEMGGIEAAQH